VGSGSIRDLPNAQSSKLFNIVHFFFAARDRESLPHAPFALSLSKGLFVVVEVFVVLRDVGRGSPAASHFLLSRQKKVTQEKATPTSPNSRKSSQPDGRRRTRPALLFLNFVFCGLGSNTFAANPPGRLDFRRGCKGRKVKTRTVTIGQFSSCRLGCKAQHLWRLSTYVRRYVGLHFIQPNLHEPQTAEC
jgi:hypothetical protein